MCVKGDKRISIAKYAFNLRLFTKTNFQFKVNVIINNDGCFTISRVSLEHNHTLSPYRASFQKCNKKSIHISSSA